MENEALTELVEKSMREIAEAVKRLRPCICPSETMDYIARILKVLSEASYEAGYQDGKIIGREE